MGILSDLLGPFHPRRMVSLIRTRGLRPEPAHDQEIKRDAAADVAAIREDDKYFPPQAPASQDDL